MDNSLEELLGIEATLPPKLVQEMCECGVLPAPCGCETVELEELPK